MHVNIYLENDKPINHVLYVIDHVIMQCGVIG